MYEAEIRRDDQLLAVFTVKSHNVETAYDQLLVEADRLQGKITKFRKL